MNFRQNGIDLFIKWTRRLGTKDFQIPCGASSSEALAPATHVAEIPQPRQLPFLLSVKITESDPPQLREIGDLHPSSLSRIGLHNLIEIHGRINHEQDANLNRNHPAEEDFLSGKVCGIEGQQRQHARLGPEQRKGQVHDQPKSGENQSTGERRTEVKPEELGRAIHSLECRAQIPKRHHVEGEIPGGKSVVTKNEGDQSPNLALQHLMGIQWQPVLKV